jgi:hypothetical protein
LAGEFHPANHPSRSTGNRHQLDVPYSLALPETRKGRTDQASKEQTCSHKNIQIDNRRTLTMKEVLGNMTKYIFGAFGLAILGLLMTLTYQALGRIFPQSFSDQIWGLVLFDIAAMCWALAFVFASETVTQYAVAGTGFLVGFIGTLLMVASEVILGQNLMSADTAQIGQWMVYGFIGATALHAILVYAHHAGGQEIKQRIDVGIAKGEVTTEAIKQATATLKNEKHNLAQTIRDGIIADVQRELGLYPVTGTPFEPPTMKYPYQDGREPIISNIPRPTEDEISEVVKAHMWDPNDPNDSPTAIVHPWAQKQLSKDEPAYHYHPIPMSQPVKKDEATQPKSPFQPE